MEHKVLGPGATMLTPLGRYSCDTRQTQGLSVVAKRNFCFNLNEEVESLVNRGPCEARTTLSREHPPVTVLGNN